jgi:DNA-binding transcriptional regulator LsrR (DeoR family)
VTPSTRQSRKDLEAQQAAYRRAVHGMLQEEIGRVLGGLSQSRVSRLLRRAEEKGWLERTYRFIGDSLPADRLAAIKRFVEPSSLVEALARVESRTTVKVRGVHVVDSGSSSQAGRSLNARLLRFGRGAADPLCDLIRRSDVCAVTWGNTVRQCVSAISQMKGRRIEPRPIRFVPVCGEPHERASDQVTSSHLAERLHEIMRSTAPVPPSLTGVSALIPRRFRGSDARGIRKFVEQAASYQEVFGTESPLIDKVDSLLTAVGPSSHPMGFIHDELLKAGSLPNKKLTTAGLSKLVIGDLGGVLFPRPGLDARGRAEVEELNKMWTGAKLSHLERIAVQAARSSRPGMIVVAMGGEDRAAIVAAAVRHGLVNELIFDRTLAEALTDALKRST